MLGLAIAIGACGRVSLGSLDELSNDAAGGNGGSPAGGCGGASLLCAPNERCIEAAGACSSTVLGCSSAGQRVCMNGEVHECDASLLSSRLLQTCDAGCDPTTVACVGAYALELEAASVAIIQGSSLGVTITLVRDDAHALPVEMAVLGLPPGVSADPLVLSSTDDFATLTLRADARAAEGVRTGLTVRASDGFSVVSQQLELFVRGEPGSLDLSFGESGRARAEPPGSPGFQGTRVLVDGADRILVAATSSFVLDPLDVPARASLTRFSADGALDISFAEGGTYLETPGSASLSEGPTTYLGGVALAPDGYVLGGPLGEGFPQEASFLTRLDADGNRANDFEAPTLDGGLRLSAVAVQNDTIVAVGASLSNAALFRSDLSGADTLGFVDSNILGAMETVFWSPADDDFILAGSCQPSACFARFYADRTPPELLESTVTNVASSSASILDATADAQGRYFAITNGWNLVRFLPEAVRPREAPPFTVVVDELATGGGSPQSLERAGERLYVAAALPRPDSETGTPAVVRYSATWARDASFGSGGIAALDAEVDVGSSVDVAVQSDGRVILATVEQGKLVVHRVWD